MSTKGDVIIDEAIGLYRAAMERTVTIECTHNVKEAMDYLTANGRSKWTVRGHEE